nr:hypothetical protein CFP56_77011 [Quercus suber]
MDSTLRRFEEGVHKVGECASNKSGYAAIGSAFDHADVHKLSSVMIQSPSSPLMHFKKRSFSSSEGLVYLFVKLMRVMTRTCTYIFLLSRDMPLCATFKSIVDGSASRGNTIIVVTSSNGIYTINFRFMDIVALHEVQSSQMLVQFFVESGLGYRVIVIGYPSLLDLHASIINSMNTTMWCSPASKELTYTSVDGNLCVHHFVYPWSKSPLCTGFTLGTGNIKYSSDSERIEYVSLYNTYESMISSVPYKTSCTDCAELKRIAQEIRDMTGVHVNTKPRVSLKRASIQALEELKARIEEYSSTS